MKSVEGVYRNGKVELRERGINESEAADLRRRLAPFAEDWDRAEMNAYDELPPGSGVSIAGPKVLSSDERV